MKPKDYTEQIGCRNCIHALRIFLYEEGPEYLCLYGEQDKSRPKYYYGPNQEITLSQLTLEESDQVINEWDKWSKLRIVEAWGFCTKWKKKLEINKRKRKSK